MQKFFLFISQNITLWAFPQSHLKISKNYISVAGLFQALLISPLLLDT